MFIAAGSDFSGDKVMVHISAARSGMEPEAEVIKIVERKQQVFIGTLHIKKYFAHLATDSKFLATDIFIPLDKLAGGTTGDKVVVRIIEWPDGSNSPIGEVVDVLGKAGENNAEIHAILAEFGLPYRYPENVERVADKLEPGITDEEVARRRDMRSVTTFTIDPADAKDYDDALSIEKLANGRWEIGVHIADVTHYVKPDSVIDKEAYARATSVYLVDRTVPMLPERLCNYICSLRPHEDKLCHSVVFEMDDNAKVLHKLDIFLYGGQTSACGYYTRWFPDQFHEYARFSIAEKRFAEALEYLNHRHAHDLAHTLISVNKWQIKIGRQTPPQAGFACAGHTNKKDVHVYHRMQCLPEFAESIS